MNDLDRLESMPLLGPSRAQARVLADQLAYRINPETHPEDALRVLICRFLALGASPQTLAQLATAEAWATQEGLTHIATRIQLLWIAEIGRAHGGAIDERLLETALATAEQLGVCETEVLLAKAACQREHRDTHLAAALKHMSEPRWAGLAFRAWLDLASALHTGADTAGAERALETALELAKAHGDPAAEIEARTRIAIHFINRGLPSTAQDHLEVGLDLARREEDDLSTVLLCSLLCPMTMQQEAWDTASGLADIMIVAGARRANWYAVVDGHVTQSTLSLIGGDPEAAISRLVRAAVHLRELVPAAAINILKGRLAELRHQLGNETFDAHYREALARNAVA